MGCCCSSPAALDPDEEDGIPVPGSSAKKAKRLERRSQKVRLNNACDSSSFQEHKLSARTRGVVAGVDIDDDDDDDLGLTSHSSNGVSTSVRAAEVEREIAAAQAAAAAASAAAAAVEMVPLSS